MISTALHLDNRSALDRFTGVAVMAVLLVAFLAGGGGSRFALANLAVQLAALAALAVHRHSLAAFWREASPALRSLVVAALLLPAVQLIPLPPAIWSVIPGRELVTRSLELTGGASWMPLSLDPLRTLLALSALITPLAVLIAGWTIPRERLVLIGWVIVGLGLLTALLGFVQLGGATDATLFGARRPGELLLGTFANRNSTGLWLGFALALALLLPAPRPHPALLSARLASGTLLLVAIILTQSRTALVLSALPLALGGWRAAGWALAQRSGRRQIGRAVPVLVVLGALTLMVTGAAALIMGTPGRLSETIERFEAKDDPRRLIWDDATYSIERYWPAGSGMGTFDEVFQVDEALENLTTRRAGRAHNDYIELAIEAGPFGLLLAALWLVLIGWLSWRARQSSLRWTAWAGSAFLVTIALQSVTDYPLRNQTMLAFAGFALLLLARIADNKNPPQAAPISRIPWWAALSVIALVTTALQIDKQSEISPAFASLVPGPLRNFAQVRVAATAVERGDPKLAVAEARKLVRQRPVPAEYLTLLALAQTKAGQDEAAGVTIQIAGQRGWRDPLAQETVLRLALAAGDKPEAARRYAALFLRAATPDALLQEIGPDVLGEAGGPGQQTMAEIVSGAERWQTKFLRRGAQVMPPKAFTAIVIASRNKGALFDCAVLDQVSRGIALRDAAAAEQLKEAGSGCRS